MVVKCQEVPVFHPTLRDVNGSWEAYIVSIERRFAHVGLAKIVPPKGWTPRKAGYSDDFDFPIPRPIRQHATGKRGLYRTLLVEQRPMSLARDFRPQAVADESLPPAKETPEEVERRFWRNVNLRPPLYGADVPGSLFDEDLKGWNLRRLDSMLSRTLDKHKVQIPGVSTPFLYFGMWRSIFAWHTEDMDLASVNYMHCGAPKAWYCVPPAHRERFERLLEGLLPDMFRACPEFFRHKELLVSPYLLLQNNIPVVRCTQFPGEFIINYPGAYHSGFNHGFNCAESTNFATKSWLPIGVQAGYCDCQKDSVAIQMSLFMDEASPRVQRMIREAEASTTVEGDPDSDTDSDASTSEADESDESASEIEEEEVTRKKPGPKPKPKASKAATKVAAQSKKPIVRGGRGMAACVKPEPKRAAAPAERKAKPAVKAPEPRRPPSRKPVGTPARAAGRRAASIPARLRPLDNTPYRRSKAQASAAKAKPGPKPGQKRSPVSANLRSKDASESPKRRRLANSTSQDEQGSRTRSSRPASAAQPDSSATKAAAAKRASQPSAKAGPVRKPARKSEQQVTVLRRVLKLTVKAAEAMSKGAVSFLGGASRSMPADALVHGAIVPACHTRSSLPSPAPGPRTPDKRVHGGPYLPPRAGKVKKPSTSPSPLVPRRPRTRPDYHKIITARCEQLMPGPQETRCQDALRSERCTRRREASLRA